MIEGFKEAIRKNRVGHSYLFVGGNEEARKIGIKFAQMLNCEQKEGEICGSCYSCQKLDALTHPDLEIISVDEFREENKENRRSDSLKIEQIRKLKTWISLKPYCARYKIGFILDAQLLTEEASNALLKTLEEPPIHSLLIIFADSTYSLVPTIVSRCQIIRFPAGQVKTEDIHSALTLLQDKEALLSKSRLEWKEILHTGLRWWRDILIFKLCAESKVLFNKEKIELIRKESERYSLEQVKRKMEVLEKSYNLINRNLNPKIVFANMLEGLKDV